MTLAELMLHTAYLLLKVYFVANTFSLLLEHSYECRTFFVIEYFLHCRAAT